MAQCPEHAKPAPGGRTARDDRGVADWAKLIEAIAGLVGAVAWPIAIVLAVWLIMRRHRDAFERFIDRVKAVSYPGGQIDLAEIEDAKKARVQELEQQLADPDADAEERRETARELANEAREWGKLSADREARENIAIGVAHAAQMVRRARIANEWTREGIYPYEDRTLRRIRDFQTRPAEETTRDPEEPPEPPEPVGV